MKLVAPMAALEEALNMNQLQMLQEIPEDTSPFSVDGFPFHALPVLHGADYTCFGYGFGPRGSRLLVRTSCYTAIPLSKNTGQPPGFLNFLH